MGASFHDLLSLAGAEAPRAPRGRWRCPRCPEQKAPALSVDTLKEVFFCHRCKWSGNAVTLKRELGIQSRPVSSMETDHRAAVLRTAAKFRRWWRERLDFYREVVAIFTDLERSCWQAGEELLQSGQEIPEWIFADLTFVLELRPHFETRYDLFADPERNRERLWREYRERLKS